jgi:hypothetical protein
MKNRLPQDLTIAKSSKAFKDMERGDNNTHLFSYHDTDGEVAHIGLIYWKDQDTVYCVMNALDTAASSFCFRC